MYWVMTIDNRVKLKNIFYRSKRTPVIIKSQFPPWHISYIKLILHVPIIYQLSVSHICSEIIGSVQ